MNYHQNSGKTHNPQTANVIYLEYFIQAVRSQICLQKKIKMLNFEKGCFRLNFAFASHM